jgi:uncharacterized membrane protein YdjX (TVP38/TMEM64 family)
MRSTTIKKTLLLAILTGLAILFFAFDLGQYLNLDYLKLQQAAINDYYTQQPLTAVLAYAAIYITVTALSLPGASIMTLAGGAVFGLTIGTLTISFASTIGATLAFLVARYLLRDVIQSRYGDRLAAINQGIEKDGTLYLFTLRLIPLFPFFIINLVMGVTPMRTWQYYLVSQIGMLPATIVYVNAGKQLSLIESPADILSPGLLLSFTLLGLFPLLTKKLVEFFRQRQTQKQNEV